MKRRPGRTERAVMTPPLQPAFHHRRLSPRDLEQVVRKELEENPLPEGTPVEAAETPGATAPGAADAPAPAEPPPEPLPNEATSVDAARADELPFDLSAAIFDDGDERTPVSMEEREELPFENLPGNGAHSL